MSLGKSVSAQSPFASQFMITAVCKFVSEFSLIVFFLFASISSSSTSGLALITVPWLLFPSWPFPPVFLTPFLSQALWSLSVPLIHIIAVPHFH